jgi:DNA-binding XRE family transcriptional regulator
MINLRKLKSMRVYHGFTQLQVEQKTGIAKGTLSMKELGYVVFNLEECLKLAKLYKMTMKDFNEIFLNNELKEC